MTEPIIEAQGLTKRFTVKKKTVEAVTDLTFQVARGELVAFLGPNGAGKSTSLRMLTTLIPPTSGTARVVGFDILRRPADVRARIGYVGQLTSGSFAQRVRDELISQGAFYGMSKRAARARADELIARVRVPLATRPQRTFYRKVGTRKAQAISKVCIAASVRDDGTARIAMGSVAPTVVRLLSVERKLESTLASGLLTREAVERMVEEIPEATPIDDIRSTAEYRRRVTRNVVRECLLSFLP